MRIHLFLKTHLLYLAWLVLLPISAIAQGKAANQNPKSVVAQRFVEQSLQVDFELRVPALGISDGDPAPEYGPHVCLLFEPKHKVDSAFIAKHGDFYGTVKSQLVQHLSDLRGKVHITSPQAALSFVRLATSPMTFFMLARRDKPGYEEIEVACRETDVPQLTFGLHDRDMRYPRMEAALVFPDGKYALISAATAKMLGITFAQVKKSGTGYRIERLLLVEDSNLYQVYFVKTVEWVGEDGEFRIEKNTKVAVKDNPTVKWELPFHFRGR